MVLLVLLSGFLAVLGFLFRGGVVFGLDFVFGLVH